MLTARKLGSNGVSPDCLLEHEGHLYWIEPSSGSVMRVPTAGGSTENLCTDEDWPNSLAWHGGYIYFATVTQIRRVSERGGNSELVLGGGDGERNPRPSGVTIGDGGELIWVNADSDICETPPGQDSWGVLARGQDGAHDLTSCEGGLYWLCRQPGGLCSIPKRGGSVECTPDVVSNPDHLCCQGATLFLADYFRGEIFSRATGTNKLDLLCRAGGAVHGLAVDEEWVYWCSRTTRTVSGARRKGGSIVTMFKTGGDPVGIAVDSHSVYWIEDECGGVYAIPKPK